MTTIATIALTILLLTGFAAIVAGWLAAFWRLGCAFCSVGIVLVALAIVGLTR